MKRTAFRILIVTGIFLLLVSCGSTYKMVTDENNPADQNATVTFKNADNGSFRVKEWNGTNVEESLYGTYTINFESGKTILTVPAGNNSFTFDITYTSRMQYTYKYTMEDIEIQYLLEAGKSYQVKGRTKSLGFLKGSELFVGIYDVTKGTTLLKEWKIGEW